MRRLMLLQRIAGHIPDALVCGVVCVLALGQVALGQGSDREIAAETESLPNIVLIIADDLGWADLGCYGADLLETPALDRMAAEGVRFTHARSPAPVCTPTRAAIMTGKHPARLKMTIWHEGALDPPMDRAMIPGKSLANLPLEEITLAEKLSEFGYLTATVGKWHLGDAAHAPETQGFDLNIGGTHWEPRSPFSFRIGELADLAASSAMCLIWNSVGRESI